MTLARSLPLPAATARPLKAPNATLVGREDITATLAVFALVLDAPLRPYAPGQYVSLGIERDGELVQRPYSIVALDPAGTRFELFVRRLPDGRLSNLLWALPLGARVHAGPARGLFVLDSPDPRPRLLVSTGTGLAPLLAMLADSAARHDATPNVLIHGVSYHAELAFTDRVGAWIARGLPLVYLPTVSRPHERRNSAWSGPTGRAESALERLLSENPALSDIAAYLCGNPDMIDSCRRVLLAAGVAARDIRAEQFHGPLGRPPRRSPRVA